MPPDLIDSRLDAALRSLDPADREVVVPARIFGAPPRPRRSRRGLAAAAVAAVVGVGVAVPSFTGGGAAFASWRPEPSSLTGDARTELGEQCLAGMRGADRVGDLTPVVAEARGRFRMVVLASPQGASAECIGTEGLANWFGGSNGPGEIRTPAPRQLIPVSLGTGNLDEGDISIAIGYAGSEVAGVSYDSAEHGRVFATLNDGWFALWFPGDEMEDQAPSAVPLTVSYTDGTSEDISLGFW
jgi:hypothetical protein